MDVITLYHGSERTIEKPIFGKKSLNSDYGDAFYCTRELYAAKEWANKRTTNGVVNVYKFDARGLKILDLTDKEKYSELNWLSILMHYRSLEPTFKLDYQKELDYLEKHYFIDVKNYDIVIGFRADDSYFTFPLMFVRSEIRLERLHDIYNLGYLGQQIAIISEKAFQRLKFQKAISVEPIFKEKYHTRIKLADDRFEEIRREERYKEGTRLIDLVKKEND